MVPRCVHCGEAVKEGQERCFACGQKARARVRRGGQPVNPLVIVAAGLAVVVVIVGLVLIRGTAARKQAALQAEEEELRAKDSVRLAGRQWADAVKAAERDTASQAIKAELDRVESRFRSVRTRVAASPSPQQESIIGRAQAELARLRRAAVVIATSTAAERRAMRDDIQAGWRRVEDLTSELNRTR